MRNVLNVGSLLWLKLTQDECTNVILMYFGVHLRCIRRMQ